jgi:hypothetical protein
MTDEQKPNRMARSIRAVTAGLLTVVVPSIATDAIMHAIGALPAFGEPMGHAHSALALAYRVVYGIAGGYVTARLAPAAPVRHAVWLGVVGLLISTAGAIATWGEGPQFGPKWYALAVVATAVPTAWFGAKLMEKRRRA